MEQHACKYNRPSLPTVYSYGDGAAVAFYPLGVCYSERLGDGCREIDALVLVSSFYKSLGIFFRNILSEGINITSPSIFTYGLFLRRWRPGCILYRLGLLFREIGDWLLRDWDINPDTKSLGLLFLNGNQMGI